MSITLTNLVPDLYESLDVVSRELVGFIPSVTLDSNVERAAVGQVVRSPVSEARSAFDITPGAVTPGNTARAPANKSITISKARGVDVGWTGEQQRGANSGPGYRRMLQDEFAQAMRTIVNEMEADLAGLHVKTSRAYGTAGTTPFASDLSDTAQVRKILADNGAPLSDMRLVIDTAAGAKMRTLTQLTKANEANDATLLRQGVLLDVHGMQIRESAQTVTSVAGTASGATTDASGYAVGATEITLASAGTGTIVAGDTITFAGDTNKYVVASGDANVADGGTITLAAPGLKVAIGTSATNITVLAASTRNMAFSRSAIILATRAPAIPEEGDQADDMVMLTDPRSGISFEVRLYKQYRQIRYEVAAAWGYELIKPEHTALLLG